MRKFIGAMALIGLVLGGSSSVAAFVDDLEEDLWTSFTHFHLGDRATAGYSSAIARSGTRSYYVEISGWAVRDFGAAYGYAYFTTRRSPITELRLAVLYDRLEDAVTSSSDAFAAGISLDLLDWRLRSVGSVRYVTEFQGSRNGGRCAPTTSDVVLENPTGLGEWTDIGRNPSADFASARWTSAEFVRISIGFLCTAGLTGARYSLYFDDFMLDTGAGDTDGDGLRDLEEDVRMYTARIASMGLPRNLPARDVASVDIAAPPVAGALGATGIDVTIDHPQVNDLSVELQLSNDLGTRRQLLWDPGFQARGAAILAPSDGSAVRGAVEIRGMAWRPNPLVQFHVDDEWVAGAEGDPTGAFRLSWNSDGWPEGPHRLFVIAQAHEGGEFVARTSAGTTILVDRTPPDLVVLAPRNGDTLSGTTLVAVGAFDRQELTSVELWIDSVLVDTRDDDLYVFPFDTLDLSNGDHVFEVRAQDAAGNVAVRSVAVRVSNKGVSAPPPCSPRCNTGGGTTIGNLPPLLAGVSNRIISLPSGDRMEVHEGFRVPWVPAITQTETGVHLVLDAARPRTLADMDGLTGSDLTDADLFAGGVWRIVVRDHGDRGGAIREASVLLSSRTAAGIFDTDADGLADGAERTTFGTIPILRDTDGDLVSDGEESTPLAMRFFVDGQPVDRIVRTDPLDFDTDDDGLPDGAELQRGTAGNPSDPMDPDTDDDGLSDGLERLNLGSDPTLTDTDGDGLTDSFEVTPRPLELEIDGVLEVRAVITSPASADTDMDGLRDDEEWDGLALYGFPTDPSDRDTDHEGLSDYDEVVGLNRNPTDPLESDTDLDGIADSLDLSPTERWDLGWQGSFEPGMVRFIQRFSVLGVHGNFAWIFGLQDDESCGFISDHTADSTRSSDESPGSVLSMMNFVLGEGGETNFTATNAADQGLVSEGFAEFTYGACAFGSPLQYRIGYIYHTHAYDIDFVNSANVVLRDDAGGSMYQSSLLIPLRIGKPQEVILQMSIEAGADRGSETVMPAMAYSVIRGTDFEAAPPFYRNLAVGTALDAHSYQFQLRIPRDVVTTANVEFVNGEPTATLLLVPMWLNSGPLGTTRSALDATEVTVGAMTSRVQESAELVVGRLDIDMEALEAALPALGQGLSTGYHTFGVFSVYVYRIGDIFDSEAPMRADAVYLIGESAEEVATFQETVVWEPNQAWTRKGQDGSGLVLNVFKILRRGISLTSQITAKIVLPFVTLPRGREQMNFGRFILTVNKLTSPETLEPYYLISKTTDVTVKIRVTSRLTNIVHSPVGGVSEVVDDLDDSRLLSGVRYANLRVALRGAAVGATLAVFGSEAIIAFRDGDAIKGTVFVLAGATATFGILKSDVELVKGLFRGRISEAGLRVRLGAVALVAVTAILVSFEIFQAEQTTDSVSRLAHFESAGAILADSMIGAVPLYGVAAMLGWQLGLNIAVGVGALLGIMPNQLAMRIVSTPGSVIVFLFEYAFASDIPSGVAEDALSQLLSFLAETARHNNSSNPPVPTLLLVP